MADRSREVSSSQTGPHPALARTVRRHLVSPDRTPVAHHTARAFRSLQSILREAPDRPLVLDSGCGTGESTRRLAALHPAAWVVGTDRSAHRLRMHDASIRRLGPQTILLRAELADLWRSMAAAGIRLGVHYILYPNPWPKPGHLKRRWHGHPAWPALLALGGRLEVRSNWRIYLEEMALALSMATGCTATPRRIADARPALSPFERKYRRSDHPLWSLRLVLPERDQRGPTCVR